MSESDLIKAFRIKSTYEEKDDQKPENLDNFYSDLLEDIDPEKFKEL